MKKLSELTAESVFNWYHLSDDMSFECVEVEPEKLINRNRLDLMAKVLYLQKKDSAPEYAKQLYLEHIRVMTKDSFVEPASSKTSKEDFINAFNALYENLKTSGFDKTKLAVPVDKNYQLLDGAHRVAAAIVLGISVPVVVLPVIAEYDTYNQAYFIEHDMNPEFLDDMMFEYIVRKKNVGCVNIWPAAEGHEEETEKLLEEQFGIIYKKKVSFNENGAFHYLAQIYQEYSWAQNTDGDGFDGVYRKLVPCFPTFDPVRIYMVEAPDFSKLTEAKETLRQLFQKEKHSLHTTDTPAETIAMAKILLSDNTIRFLNQCKSLKYKNTLELLKEGKDKYQMDRMVYTGSIVLALYGVRQAEDLDYLTLDEDPLSHNDLLQYYGMSVEEAINDPGKTFTYFGLPFLTLESVAAFKKARNEGKDQDDLKLIKLVLESSGKESFQVRFLQAKRRATAKVQGLIIRTAHKTGTYDLMRNIYKALKGKK